MSDLPPDPDTDPPPTPPAVVLDGWSASAEPTTPPVDDVVWYDPARTFESVLRQLRMQPSDPDAPAVAASVTSAASLIDQYLDRSTPLVVPPTVGAPLPPPPEPVQLALEQLAVELYRRKDAPFSLLNATVPEDVPLDLSGVNVMQSVAQLVQPWKQRWGFA